MKSKKRGCNFFISHILLSYIDVKLKTFWILAIFICARLTVADEEVYKYKVCNRNKAQQVPPTTTTSIMQTTHTYCYCRNEHNQGPNDIDNRNAAQNKIKQSKPPELRATSTSAKCRILAEASLN